MPAWTTVRKSLLAGGLVAAVVGAVVVVHEVSGPDCGDCLTSSGGGTITATVRVRGESGEALADARVAVQGVTAVDAAVELTTDDDGLATTPALSGPAVAVVSADGYLTEPVSLGWADGGKTTDVTLLARTPGRFVLHLGGDLSFGKQDPAAAADAGPAAERAVEALAPAFAAADIGSVDLETVLSDKPETAAYPGRRPVRHAPAAAVAGLRKLSVDVAGLANDHARDLLDPGLADTRAALAAVDIGAIGAGADPAEAAKPLRTTTNGTTTSMLAYTDVDGSAANAQLPTASTRKPADLSENQAWQYQSRDWGFTAGAVRVPRAARPIRAAWELYTGAERKASPADAAAMWQSLSAVYPEVQDWVARRGHGGAALWDDTTSPEQIRAAAADSKVVVVQVHGGHQFADAPADTVRAIARKAVDAGADLVVAHHSQVPQGMEWYKGKLVVYGLGDLVSDLSRVEALESGFLRTVWDGDKLLQARVLPVENVAGRPAVVTDQAAARALAHAAERSPLESYEDTDGVVRTRLAAASPDTRPAHLVLDRHTILVTDQPAPETPRTVTLPPGQVRRLPDGEGTLVRPTSGTGVEVGRDLFGWGDFEDDVADSVVTDAVHWNVNSKREGLQTGDTAEGLRSLRLEADGGTTQTRPVATVALPRHRLFETRRGKAVAVDADPSYSLVVRVRRSAGATPEARFEIARLTGDPGAEAPELVTTVSRPITVPDDGGWHEVVVDLTAADLAGGRQQATVVTPYVKVTGVPGRTEWAEVDDLHLVEWRALAGSTTAFGDYTMARNRGKAEVPFAYVARSPRASR
ncbi:CapA family protein [Actinokineospora sp. NBRC 105648]|uniref:CapA family protein n=1 Tax=Actinokineospora sp. NBRC 105648 TaxID=3032206 RepID=UPI0024A4A44A|nr:CapA family protein [Actinokineospora sp. NBRC 105648]GLZ41841.1 hypothetical protein Acsp05_54650 [Actinokineospora sp. NBRC 105648]